jgi:hypothetical protein
MRTAVRPKFVPLCATAALMLGASTASLLAAVPPELAAQVDALVARIDAAGEPRLKARAYTLHCQCKNWRWPHSPAFDDR